MTRGIDDAALAGLARRYWEGTMERNPEWASDLGDHRYDDRVSDNSRAAHEADATFWNQLRGEIGALSHGALSDRDALTAKLLDHELHIQLLENGCDFGTWQFSARDNPMVDAQSTASLTQLGSEQDAANWVKRIEAWVPYVQTDAANRRIGASAGRAPTRKSVELTLEQVREVVAAPVDDVALMEPFRTLPEDWDPATRAQWRERGRVATAAWQQALGAWVAAIEADVLPITRADDAPPGLAALPDGERCYRAMVEHHTGLPLDPAVVHQTGLDEIARIQAELATLAKVASVQEVFERLRTGPALYFETEQQVEDKAREALARAKAAIPAWFGTLPRTDCDVARIPDYLAPYTTVAYYMPLAVGERDGTYYINTYAPTTRPRHEAEVLAFHESIPGHHLQIAISQEQADLPLFRRHLRSTAFVEGWALYTEQLADEMGLYSSDVDRFGMYGFELWRAARLVVDTGIHHQGWTREQAVTYMEQNTPLARNNIVNEVDRYINTPGQALAYKIGQLEIWKLRREAEATLGERFDIKGFHDIVLEAGAVTLPVLRERVEAWVERQES